VLCNDVLRCVVLCCVVRCCAVLCSALLCFALLCCAVLCCAVLGCIVPAHAARMRCIVHGLRVCCAVLCCVASCLHMLCACVTRPHHARPAHALHRAVVNVCEFVIVFKRPSSQPQVLARRLLLPPPLTASSRCSAPHP